MDGLLGFIIILSMQVATISCLKFISKANGMCKRLFAKDECYGRDLSH